MNGRLVALVVVLGVLTTVGAGVALARPDANPAPPGKCPDDPAKALSIEFAVSIFRGGKLVGTTFCHDGATAKVKLAGQTHSFKDGVCFRQSGALEVKIGSIMVFKRRPSDPAGFGVTDVKPSKIFKDIVEFGLTKSGKVVGWRSDVKLIATKGSAPKGTFTGVEQRLVNGKLTKVPASGSFACKRVLSLPG